MEHSSLQPALQLSIHLVTWLCDDNIQYRVSQKNRTVFESW